MRKAALAVIVVGIASLMAVLRLLERSEVRTGAAAPAQERAGDTARPTELVAGEITGDMTRAPVVASGADPVPQAEDVPLAGAVANKVPRTREPTALRGTIVVVDEQGTEHPAEDGEFTLMLWSGNGGTGHEVEVERGRWNTLIPGDTEFDALALHEPRLGERAAFDLDRDSGARFPVPPDGWLELRVRWARRSILSVRDRESGRELGPVLVTEVASWPEKDYGHPGMAARAARDLGPSPVEIPPPQRGTVGFRTLFARSPGYAWSRIEIDERQGGDRIVSLDPAGELEVVLAGSLTDPGTELRIFGEGFQPVLATSILGPTVRVETLAAGRYRVKVEIGNFWDDPLVLGEAAVEVVAGRRSGVTIALADVAPREDVALAGTLVLPEEWGLERFFVVFELLETPLGGREGLFSIDRSAMETEKLPPGTYRWSTSSVQPGRYKVALPAVGFLDVLVVPLTGLDDVRIEIPPPCEVSVRCIDDETGAETRVERVTWTCRVPEGLKGWSLEDARWHEASARWEFRAPRTELAISTWGQDIEGAETTIVAVAGRNEAELRVRPATGLRLVLRDGETLLPWQDEWRAAIRPLEGQAEHEGWCWAGNVRHRQPGRYTLEVGEIPGYEPIPAADVRLEKGLVKEHVIELRRRP